MGTARGAALRALVAIERGRASRLREQLDGSGLEGRELAFAYELAHGVLRRERLLDFVLESWAQRGLPRDPQLVTALRLGVYQLLFVPGMPAHAAVHETVELVRSNRGFANAVLRNVAQAVQLADDVAGGSQAVLPLGPTRVLVLPRPLPEDEVERISVVHSLPGWLCARVCEQRGIEALRQVAAAASATPGVFLRVVGDGERDALAAALGAVGVEVEPAEHGRLLRWSGGESPFATPSFRAGRFVVQDPTALAAVEAVACVAGETVVDLCAAPGTKTTLLAERVRPGGRVFAFDPVASRRERIAENVARLSLADTVTTVDDVSTLPVADHVLTDVPCSNTGVLGRRVEVRRRLEPDTFAEMATLQRELLAQSIRLCRAGGTVVYSTCSIDREENEDVVAAVLADPGLPRCELVRSVLTMPLAGRHDGGFHAVLRRNG